MYWIVKRTATGSVAITEFGMDTDADLADLPTSTTEGVDQGDGGITSAIVDRGSTAFSVESSTTYMLNSNNIWTEVAISTAGGSSADMPANLYYPKEFQQSGQTYGWVNPAATDYSGENFVPVYVDSNGDSHFPISYSDSDAIYVIVDDNGDFTIMTFTFSTSSSAITLDSSTTLSENLFVID